MLRSYLIVHSGCLLLSLFVLNAGCSTVAQKLDPTVYYKRDMQVCLKDKQGKQKCQEGTAVLPKADSYQLEFRSRGNMDLFTFTTCHREQSREKVSDNTEMLYTPAPGIEDGNGCRVELGGYEVQKGRHSWGVIDFEDAGATLPATVKCNGEVKESRGVSICQSRAGLIERVEFPVAVMWHSARKTECPIPPSKDGKNFQFVIPLGECVYAIAEDLLEGSPRIHRLTTIGYEGILIRQ